MDALEKNLEQLKAKFPAVHAWITSEREEDSSLEIIHPQTQAPNLRLKGVQGRSIHLYNMDDPLGEERETIQNIDFSPDRVSFIIGIGLGYIIEAIKEKRAKGHRIVVVEPNPTILKMALSRIDMTELILEDAIVFLLPDEENVKIGVIKNSANLSSQDVIIASNQRLLSIRNQYVELKDLVCKYIGSSVVGHNTVFHNCQVFGTNEIENFPKFLFSSGVKNLHNLFKKVPAVIISAGPSLEKNVHLLSEAKGKGLLIATAPVVRVLLAHDIEPDFVVSIDFAKENRAHFEGLCDREELPLIYPIRLASNIVRDFQGRLFAIQDFGGFCNNLSRNWEFKGFIRGGGSVAIHALMAALFFGCDPLVFVGQDLAFTNKSHANGVHLAEKLDPQKAVNQYIWVEGIYGEKVPTVQAFLTFQCTIEDTIANFDRRFINSTEGGVKLKGAEILPLKECLDRFFLRTIDISDRIQAARKVEEVDFAGLTADLGGQLAAMKRMSTFCIQGLKSNKRIKKRIGLGRLSDADTKKIIAENYYASTEVQKFCESSPLLSTYLTKEIYQINRHEFVYKPAEYDRQKDLEVGLRRNRLILTAAHQSLKTVHHKLFDLLMVLQKVAKAKTRLKEIPEDPRGHILYGKVLTEIGLHRLAFEEYGEAHRLGGDSPSLLYELGRSSLRLGKLKQARKYFERAQAGARVRESAVAGLAEVDETFRRWRGKAESYLRNDNWANALLYARKVLREDPGCEQAQTIADKAMRLRDEAVARIEEENTRERALRQKKKEYQGWIDRGKELFNQKEYSRAVEAFLEALKKDGDPVEIDGLLACCYSEMGEIQKAEKLLQDLSAHFPAYGIFHVNLGRAYVRNGRLRDAAQEYEKAFHKENHRYYTFLFEAGSIYMGYKEYAKAIECFEKFYERSPDSFEILTKIGTCHLAEGRVKRAKEKFEEALRIQPNYEAARLGLEKIEGMERRTAFPPAISATRKLPVEN